MFILYPLPFSDLGTCCLPLPESSLQELIEMLLLRGFTGGPVVKTLPSNAGGGVQSLVGELRSHMTHGEAKRLKKRKKETFLLQLFPYYLFFFYEIQLLSNTMLSSLPKHISLFDNQKIFCSSRMF